VRSCVVGTLVTVLSILAACRRSDTGPASTERPLHQRSAGDPGPPTSPLDLSDTAGAKQRFVEILRHHLNERVKDPAREGQWDFWSEGSSAYALPNGQKAYLMSFRRVSPTDQEGFLVIGTIFGTSTVVHGSWRVPAGIDDIHVMSMGKAGPMIYVVAFDTTATRRVIHQVLLRYDGQAIQRVWSYTTGYDVTAPQTYQPANVSFHDEDGDGVPEVRLRIPGKDTPKLWRRRYAVFRYQGHPVNEFLPWKGLAFTPAAQHQPHWMAAAFLEAIRQQTRDELPRMVADQPGCKPADELWEVLQPARFKVVSAPRYPRPVQAATDRQADVHVDLEQPKDGRRFLGELKLVRTGGTFLGWRLCKIRLYHY
jgi:hypothetical protein